MRVQKIVKCVQKLKKLFYLNMLYGWCEYEGLALDGDDVDVVDDESVGLSEESTLSSGDGNIA